MPSVLRQLQSEWNALVPAAREIGLRRVVHLERTLEPIAYRRERLDWLRDELARRGLNADNVRSIREAAQTTAAAAAPVVLGSSDHLQFTFGMEIEMMVPSSTSDYAIAAAITASGVECRTEGYGHAVRTYWKIVSDGSLGNYARGREVVSPILRGVDGIEQARKVLRVLKSAGCKISKKCGLHIHVGAQGQELSFFRNLVRSYDACRGVIEQFLAPSRRGNGYCLPLRFNSSRLDNANTVSEILSACGQTGSTRGNNRYRDLNLLPMNAYGTVEFRHHQGTVEEERAINWLLLCLRMCAAARSGVVRANTVQELMERIGASSSEQGYFVARTSYFANAVLRGRRAA